MIFKHCKLANINYFRYSEKVYPYVEQHVRYHSDVVTCIIYVAEILMFNDTNFKHRDQRKGTPLLKEIENVTGVTPQKNVLLPSGRHGLIFRLISKNEKESA